MRYSPDLGEAHRGLAYCLDEAGDEAGSVYHRDAAFRGRAVTALPWRGTGKPVALLMLVAARGGNIPSRFLLDDRVFATTIAVADYLDTAAPLPAHDLLFNAIGDADLAGSALADAQRIAARSRTPVINRPERVAVTGRAEVARRLTGVEGVRVPRFEILPRAVLEGPRAASTLAARGFIFPLLLRALGFHTGRHFLRVESAAGLTDAVAQLPGRSIAAIEYLEARGVDGYRRKYRVMMIDGRLFPLHLAISEKWKIHYFTAAMADHPEHRDEEAAFLADMPAAIGRRATAALEAVQDALGLDYGGIDFGLSPDGELLLFEANATMVINPAEPDPCWDYRRAAIRQALDAVRGMLLERAGVTFVPPGTNIG